MQQIETMQFRDFIFHHNPYEISISEPEELASVFCPGLGETIQHLGRKMRTVRCKGSFYGGSYRQAISQLEEFRQKTKDAQRGVLLVPGLRPFMAYLKELSFSATGDGKIIPYTMLFVESREADSQ